MPAAKQSETEVLRRQVIDLNGPGTVLRDFESLLEFIGVEGLRSTGKYHLLPLDRLQELDERMSHPFRPQRERPQQRSFPHLNGLYLLLRATRLGVAKGMGKKTGRLVLDSAMVERWHALNWTEKYFNLLDAWLLLGSAGILGEPGSQSFNAIFWKAQEIWLMVPKKGWDLRKTSVRSKYSYWLSRPVTACMFALFELFGLLEIERGEPPEGEIWPIRIVRRTEFGAVLMERVFAWHHEQPLSSFDEESPPDLGVLQPLLQEYFPEWRHNLQFPEPEFRDGVYYFKVSLGGPWRRIAIPADGDLEELARSILRAFKFDGDHLYDFRFCERDGREVHIAHPYIDDAWLHTDEYSIGYLPLEEGESMAFLYDYGTNWNFGIKLEKIESPNRRMKKARIVESHGEAPREYGYDEDDW